MARFQALFQEIHRRGLWQSAAAYFGIAWAVLEFMDLFTDRGLLPGWTFSGALLALGLGLPVVLATAYIQTPNRESAGGVDGESEDGTPSLPADHGLPAEGFPVRYKQVFTWRRALLGGVLAFAALGIATAGFGVMRVTGIGAPGTLLAQGVIEEGGLVILADFQGTGDTKETADLVTEALRIDLEQSPTFELMDPREVEAGLARMVRSGDDAFSEEIAVELAIREGAEVVVAGDVSAVGEGYLITGRLMAAEDGTLLATFRETPRNPSQLIDAIDAISGKIRSKMGEALRSVAATEPLSTATTTSVEALRKFTYVAHREPRGAIPGPQAIQIIEEAIALDTTFAEAYRYLAILINNTGGSVQRGVEASEKAYQYRDRLPIRDQLLVEGNYHLMATGDYDQAARAYWGLVELDSLDSTAATNLADILIYAGEHEQAEWALSIVPRPDNLVWTWNHMVALAGQHRFEDGEALLEQAVQHQPDNVFLPTIRGLFYATAGEWEKALAVIGETDDEEGNPFITGTRSVAYAQAGKLSDAEVQLDLVDERLAEYGNPVDRITNAIARASMRGWLQGDSETAVEGLRTFLQTLPMETLGPIDRSHSRIALTLATLGAVGEAQSYLDRYRTEVSDLWDPVGRARAAVANAVIQVSNGLTPADSGLDEAVALIRCARCRAFYQGQSYALAGDTRRAIEAYEAYLADGFFDAYLIETHILTPVIHERLGYLYAEAGDTTRAAEHFLIFADQWSQADPELQPRVARARELAAGTG